MHPLASSTALHRSTAFVSVQCLNLRLIRTVARNPLNGLPPEVFDYPLVSGWGPFGRALHVMDPDLIQDVLVRRPEVFGRVREHRRVLGPILGESILVAEGEHWRRQRRAVAPAFQPTNLRTFAPAMLASAQETRDRWLLKSGETLRLGHEMMRTTFAAILATMLSGPGAVDAARFEQAMAETMQPVSWVLAFSLLGLPSWTPYPGRGRARRATVYLRNVAAQLVAEHRQTESGPSNLLTLLQAMVDSETGITLNNEELVDNLLTFIIAGHETTALSLTWTFHLLSAYPDVEAKVLHELYRVTDGKEIALEHLERLPFLNQVLLEALRLFPPAALIPRAVQKSTELGGVQLEAGSVVVIPTYALHRHKLFWDEPERFDPERFATGRSTGRHKYAFIPFGGGPRSCIGTRFAVQQAVTVLAVLLQRFKLRPAVGAVAPAPTLRVTLRPSHELLMIAEPR